ncbi:hypothetical protein [Allosphingosinicella sp.]|uniref:hypothetical protein n=1 Tax=Allosphingosinicella sp. TaxID=2823234 RepID=UPI002FC12473
MQRTQIFAAASVAALLSLAACNQEPEVISANGVDPQADELAKAPPVELPPAIQASRTYRCDDNSLVYATFYTNNTVKVSAEQGVNGTILTAQDGQPPFVAEGYSLSANADEVSYTAPGKGTQTCHI